MLLRSLDEEEKVESQDSATEESSGLSTGAVTDDGENTLEVGGGEVLVGYSEYVASQSCSERLTAEVDDENVDDELGDLKSGKVLLPLESQLGYLTVCYEVRLTQILAPPAVAK